MNLQFCLFVFVFVVVVVVFFNDDGTMMNFESGQRLTHSLTKKSVTNGKLSSAAVHTYLNSKKIYILRIITVTGVTMGYFPIHLVITWASLIAILEWNRAAD